MYSELHRLASFSQAELDMVCAPRLARSGYYYDGERRAVFCFSCALSLDLGQIESTVTAEQLHRKLSPYCAFVHSGDDKNVTLNIEPWNPREDEWKHTDGIDCQDSYDHHSGETFAANAFHTSTTKNSPGKEDSCVFRSETLNEFIRRSSLWDLYVDARTCAEKRRRKISEVDERVARGESAMLVLNDNKLQALVKVSPENTETLPENINVVADERNETNLVGKSGRLAESNNEAALANNQSAAFNTQSINSLQGEKATMLRNLNGTSPNNPRRTLIPVVVDRRNPDYNLLKIESVRLSTYHDWPPTSKIAPQPLAKEGFFYTGYSDRVQCAFCKEHLRNWDAGDDPAQEHRKHFPNCPFVQRVECGKVEDVSGSCLSEQKQHQEGRIAPPQVERPNCASETSAPSRSERPSTSDEDDTSSGTSSGGLHLTGSDEEGSQNLMISESHANSPNFVTELSRINSFDGKLIAANQTPKKLAEAGFFYSNTLCNVRCFFCNGELKNEMDQHDAWTEHARWFPECLYVKKHKSDEFIQEALSLRDQLAKQNHPAGTYMEEDSTSNSTRSGAASASTASGCHNPSEELHTPFTPTKKKKVPTATLR